MCGILRSGTGFLLRVVIRIDSGAWFAGLCLTMKNMHAGSMRMGRIWICEFRLTRNTSPIRSGNLVIPSLQKKRFNDGQTVYTRIELPVSNTSKYVVLRTISINYLGLDCYYVGD